MCLSHVRGDGTNCCQEYVWERSCKFAKPSLSDAYTLRMKKLTRKMIEWNRIHARDSNRRRLASKRKALARRRESCGVSSRKVKVEGSKGSTRIEIKCPKIFSLELNNGGVIEVLERIRSHENRQRNERLYINFREIEDLSSSAALVLAAELDRFNEMPINRKNRLKAIDVKSWNPRIRRLLAEMGFFELLNVTQPIEETMNGFDHSNVRYVKFRTGSKADGEAIFKLVEEDLMPVIGVMPRGHYLYAAVTEAMTNVVHHAYPPSSHRPNWWLAASHEIESQKVKIMIYDQGVGIPKTLPRRFADVFQKFRSSDHAHIIRAAHDLSRTASQKHHRGHGLQRDARGYLEQLDCSGYYRVMSLRGEYVFERPPEGGTVENMENHSRSIGGTLIEWELTLK